MPTRHAAANDSVSVTFQPAGPTRARRRGELPTFLRNRPVFLRSNHEYADARTCAGDLGVEFGPSIQLFIEFNAKKFQRAARGSAHVRRVLAYPGSKHQRINSAQHSSHASNGALQ